MVGYASNTHMLTTVVKRYNRIAIRNTASFCIRRMDSNHWRMAIHA